MIKNLLLLILGFICLGLGVVGIILPVMPTTPFVLLAAMCFSMSNHKLYSWLRHNRIFGSFIESYRTKQGISRKHKIASILFVWVGLTISMIRFHDVKMYIILGLVGIGVTVHLLMIKTKK